MPDTIQDVLAFLERQKPKHAAHFPGLRCEKVLTFMGTTSRPGAHLALSLLPVVSIERCPNPSELRVRLRGPLPRTPEPGECITVHLTRFDEYQGYQVKTLPLAAPAATAELFERSGDELVVSGNRVYTVHHSPYTMRFFEQVPYDEVQEMVGGLRFAMVGVGETANISPRFVFHVEATSDKLALYHGDGLPLKTYINLKANRQESRLVIDLDDFGGYLLQGAVREFQPQQHPEAYERICQGFAAGNWGKPARVFRLEVDAWQPIAPAAPALRAKSS